MCFYSQFPRKPILRAIDPDGSQRPKRQVDPFCMCLVCVLVFEMPLCWGRKLPGRCKDLRWEIHTFFGHPTSRNPTLNPISAVSKVHLVDNYSELHRPSLLGMITRDDHNPSACNSHQPADIFSISRASKICHEYNPNIIISHACWRLSSGCLRFFIISTHYMSFKSPVNLHFSFHWLSPHEPT